MAASPLTGWLVYPKICVLTAANTVPFIAFVWSLTDLTSMDPEPCDEGCIFLRPLGGRKLPSTRMPFLGDVGSANSSELRTTRRPPCFWGCGNDTWEFLPRFVFVRNGQPWNTSAVVDRWIADPLEAPVGLYFFGGAGWALTGTSLMVYASSLVVPPRQTPFPEATCRCVNATNRACHRPEPEKAERMAQRLNECPFRTPYVYCALAWAALQMLHDALLHGTGGECEACTLKIGLLSHLFQMVACCFAFSWSVSILGVFTLDHADPQCTAYYQLPVFQAVLAMTSPWLLFYQTFTKQCTLGRSIQFGDYLYCMRYDLPYRFASASSARDPSDTMLSSGLRGEAGAGAALAQKLTFAELCTVSYIFDSLYWIWAGICILIGGFAVPILFIRLLELILRTTGTPLLLRLFQGAIVGLVAGGIAVHHAQTWGHLRTRPTETWWLGHIPRPRTVREAVDYFHTVVLWWVPFAVFPPLFGEGPLAIEQAWRLAYSSAFLYFSYGEAYIDMTLRPIRASLTIRLLHADRRSRKDWKELCKSLPPAYAVAPYAALAEGPGTESEFLGLLAAKRAYLWGSDLNHGEATREVLESLPWQDEEAPSEQGEEEEEEEPSLTSESSSGSASSGPARPTRTPTGETGCVW